MSQNAPPDLGITTKPRTREVTETRRVPPFNVILENDDHHTFDFVIEVLCKALGYSFQRSYQLTNQAHQTGRAVVWTGPKEVAELKVDRIRTFHQVHPETGINIGPLGCTIEPAPGG